MALTREIPSLTGVVLGIRWGPGSDPALHDNLVAAAMLCGSDGNVRSDQDLVFFNQVVSQDASVARLTELLGDDDDQGLMPDDPPGKARFEQMVIAG